jgi:hypothetical protein
VNLEESDDLVGVVFLQMPTTRGRVIGLDADDFAAQTISRSGVQGGPGGDDPVGGSTGVRPTVAT